MIEWPEFFRQIPDPRRAQGRRHPLMSVLAIATAAVLCGARGYQAISDWAKALSPLARARETAEPLARDGFRRLDVVRVLRSLSRERHPSLGVSPRAVAASTWILMS